MSQSRLPVSKSRTASVGVEGAVDRGHWGYNRTKDRKTRTLAPGAGPKVLLRKNGKLALFIVCLACES